MKGPGALALAAMVLFAPLAASAGASRPSRSKKVVANQNVRVSPDGLRRAVITRRGLRLDHQLVRTERGKVISVVWRTDSRALAFLQRTELGLQLVVLPRLDSSPLTWRLPAHAQDLSKIYWIGDTRIGVGAKELAPRVVVSWRSVVRTSSRNFY